MMKRSLMMLLLILAPITVVAEGQLGVGIALGTPTGVTAKYWSDGQTAIDVAAEWRSSDRETFYIHSNYLVHQQTAQQPKELKGVLSYYYGVGTYYQDRENKKGEQVDAVALRLPLGLSLKTQKIPLELFGEIVPVLEVAPDSDFELDLGIGLRYLF